MHDNSVFHNTSSRLLEFFEFSFVIENLVHMQLFCRPWVCTYRPTSSWHLFRLLLLLGIIVILRLSSILINLQVCNFFKGLCSLSMLSWRLPFLERVSQVTNALNSTLWARSSGHYFPLTFSSSSILSELWIYIDTNWVILRNGRSWTLMLWQRLMLFLLSKVLLRRLLLSNIIKVL